MYTVAISRTNRYNNKSTNNSSGINRGTDAGGVGFLKEDWDAVNPVVAVEFLQQCFKLRSSLGVWKKIVQGGGLVWL